MKKQLIKLLQPLLHKCGLRLLRSTDYQRQVAREQLLEKIINENTCSGRNLDLQFIIFSKDRALQLHSLLSSMLQNIRGNFTLKVLYYASSEAHLTAYQEVEQLFAQQPNCHWIQEQSFRSNLIETLENSNCQSTCFLVDDIVFTRPINLESLDWPTYSKGILSLRLGREITFCYTKQHAMDAPSFAPANASDQTLQFTWGASRYDWDYPLSVDGHIFPTHEMQVAVKELSYNAPNTFERALQRLSPLYSQRPGYCFSKPRLLNIPLNRVQDEVENISGDISPEELLEKWNEGLALDIQALQNIATNSVHKEVPVQFSTRSAQET